MRRDAASAREPDRPFRLAAAVAAAALVTQAANVRAGDEQRAAEQLPIPALAQQAQPPGGDARTAARRDPLVPMLWPAAKGNGDPIRERRVVRALVTYSHTHYFLDGARQRGISYELLRLFERRLNAKYRAGRVPISVVVIPVAHDQLIPQLRAGRGDIAAGLTVTEAAARHVDFAEPVSTGVRQIVVGGPERLARERLPADG